MRQSDASTRSFQRVDDGSLDGLSAAQRQHDATLRNDIAALLVTRPTAAERIHVMR